MQLFQDFLRSQYGEENLNFWLAVEEYKKSDDTTRAEKARMIYEDYVSTLSPTEVSLTLLLISLIENQRKRKQSIACWTTSSRSIFSGSVKRNGA